MKDKFQTHKCDKCPKVFYSISTLKKHIQRDHKLLTIKCDSCDSFFKTNSELKNHLNAIHIKNNSYICPICFQGFPTKSAETNHFKRIHTIPQFYCTKCGTGFPFYCHLTQHLNRSFCGRSETNQDKLKRNELLCSYFEVNDIAKYKLKNNQNAINVNVEQNENNSFQSSNALSNQLSSIESFKSNLFGNKIPLEINENSEENLPKFPCKTEIYKKQSHLSISLGNEISEIKPPTNDISTHPDLIPSSKISTNLEYIYFPTLNLKENNNNIRLPSINSFYPYPFTL